MNIKNRELTASLLEWQRSVDGIVVAVVLGIGGAVSTVAKICATILLVPVH
jgi:hypothetical protein